MMVAMDTRLGGRYCAISDVTYFTSIDSHALGFELIRTNQQHMKDHVGVYKSMSQNFEILLQTFFMNF